MAENDKKPPVIEIRLLDGGTQKLEGPVEPETLVNNSAVSVLRNTLREVERGDILHLLIVGQQPNGQLVVRFTHPVDFVMFLGLLECAKKAMFDMMGMGREITRKPGPGDPVGG